MKLDFPGEIIVQLKFYENQPKRFFENILRSMLLLLDFVFIYGQNVQNRKYTHQKFWGHLYSENVQNFAKTRQNDLILPPILCGCSYHAIWHNLT